MGARKKSLRKRGWHVGVSSEQQKAWAPFREQHAREGWQLRRVREGTASTHLQSPKDDEKQKRLNCLFTIIHCKDEREKQMMGCKYLREPLGTTRFDLIII